MIQIITAIGPNIVNKLFDEVEIRYPILPADSEAGGSTRLYKNQNPPVITAATETWDKIRELLRQAARDGWDAVKAKFDGLTDFISEQMRELGNLADEYEQLLLEKLHEMMRKTSELLLKSVNQQVQIGQQTYILDSINLETKLVFSASVEASVTTLGKFLGSGETTIKGTYSIPK